MACFTPNFQSNGFINQLGFSSNSPPRDSNDGGRTAIADVLTNPYPSGIIQPPEQRLARMTGVGQTNHNLNRNYKIPDAN